MRGSSAGGTPAHEVEARRQRDRRRALPHDREREFTRGRKWQRPPDRIHLVEPKPHRHPAHRRAQHRQQNSGGKQPGRDTPQQCAGDNKEGRVQRHLPPSQCSLYGNPDSGRRKTDTERGNEHADDKRRELGRIRESRARNNHACQRHADAEIGAVILPADEPREQSAQSGARDHREDDAAQCEMRVVPGDAYGGHRRTERGVEQRVATTELRTTPARRCGRGPGEDERDRRKGPAPCFAERLDRASQCPRGRPGRDENRNGEGSADKPGPR